MTQQQAIQRLTHLLQAAATVSQEGGRYVSLTLYGRQPRGETMFIDGRNSPRGRVVSWIPEGGETPSGTIVLVEALDLAAWCCAQLQMRGVEVDLRVSEEVRDDLG